MNARPITACALALAFLALSGRDASAQDRGQNRGQNRRPDTTRTDTLPEGSSGANVQGGHVTTDADRAVIAADQARKAAQAEQDRQRAMQGRSNNNDQDRNRSNNDRDRSYNPNDRDRSYNPQDRDRNDRNRSYSGRDPRFPRGEPTFNDRDRQVTRDWYRQHRSRLGAGWRDRDRLPPNLERRLRRGQRLDATLRQRMYWLPPDLAQMYGPPPRGYRYAIIGGNIILIDDVYNVHDVFRIEFNF